MRNWTYEQFVTTNPEKDLTPADYIHAICKFTKLPDDFYICMARLFCPSFFKIEEAIFISEEFNKSAYDEYVNLGYSAEKAQSWVNQVEITSIFYGVKVDAAQQIADLIVSIWNGKLEIEFGKNCRVAKVVVDREMEEVFVTIGNFEASV